MSHYPIRPQLGNAWICTFCGTKYPSEQERDLHMAGNCKDSPVPLIEKMRPQQSRQRPPMMKAKMFSHPEYHPRLDQVQGCGYGYPKPPNTLPQPLFQSQVQPPSGQLLPPRPGIPVPSQMQYPPAQQWEQPSSLRGYAPPHVQQETGHSGYGVIRERFGYNKPPNEPDISPLAKVNSPLTPSRDKSKVTFIWKKEIPTSEREVTYIDNIEDPVTLAWSDDRELFQGNAIFSQGNHTGSLLFPTSGEMQAVQPFEVEKKEMAMAMVALKLAESPIKSEPSKLPTPSSIPKLPKNESEEAKRENFPPTEKENKGMREQLLKQNQELKDKEEKIRKMREEMDCLNKTIDTVEEDKRKVKKEMVKMDEQLFQVMTEMSSIRIHGSSEEQKSLKNELGLLQHREPIDGDELLAAKEQIDQLKSHIKSLGSTKLQNDQLKEKIKTLELEKSKQEQENRQSKEELENKIKTLDEELEEEKMKRENVKLENELGKTEDLEEMRKDIETNKMEQLDRDLKSERESSAILKQLIGKLNEDNQTGEETVIKLKEELDQAYTCINNLEYKFEQMYLPESEDHQSD